MGVLSAFPATGRWPRRVLVLLGLAVMVAALPALLAACGKPPVKLAFMGGITGRTSDLGVAGRDGVTLAVEQANAAGGILGRQVLLEAFDDQQHPGHARDTLNAIQAAGHQVVVGPMTSAMATAVVPLANQAGLLLVSPTVTSPYLSGLDDQFFRVVSSVQDYARKSVDYHARHGPWKRYAVILDDGNKDYTRGWLAHFEEALRAQGGELLSTQAYQYEPGLSFVALARQALAPRPDAVLILAGAVDAAQLAQALRKLAPSIPLVTSEWAATEQLASMGGRAVEGVFTAQFLDRDSKDAPYLEFASAFSRRFGRAPGFAELAAYDAARVALQALAQQQPGETLKATVLRLRRFDGVQQPIVFDDFGDARRETIITTIRDGRFVVVPD